MKNRYELVQADGAQIIKEDGRPMLEVIGTNSDDAMRLTSQLNRLDILVDECARIQAELGSAVDG